MVGQLIIAAVLVIGVFVCTTPRSRVAEHVLRRVSDDRPSAFYGTVRRQTSQDLAAPRWRGSLRRPRQPVRAAREAALPACYRAFARPQPGGRALKWREARRPLKNPGLVRPSRDDSGHALDDLRTGWFLRCGGADRAGAGGFVLCPARRARRAGCARRGLRRVLFGGRRSSVDPAFAAGQGVAAAVPHRALRRAGDGGGGLGSALEDRARAAGRPPGLEPEHADPLSRPVALARQGALGA